MAVSEEERMRLAELEEFIDRVKTMIEEEWSVTGTFGDEGIGQALRDAEDIAALLAAYEASQAEVARLRTVLDAARPFIGEYQLMQHEDTNRAIRANRAEAGLDS